MITGRKKEMTMGQEKNNHGLRKSSSSRGDPIPRMELLFVYLL